MPPGSGQSRPEQRYLQQGGLLGIIPQCVVLWQSRTRDGRAISFVGMD